MEVRCDRCKTEYDFDDALVSELGTTVRCTNCGYQFKVFPAQDTAIPELWIVTNQTGQEFAFTSLRDLQTGLAAGQIGPDDTLSRGQGPPRVLRTIAELEPFFARHAVAPQGANTLPAAAPRSDGASKAQAAPSAEVCGSVTSASETQATSSQSRATDAVVPSEARQSGDSKLANQPHPKAAAEPAPPLEEQRHTVDSVESASSEGSSDRILEAPNGHVEQQVEGSEPPTARREVPLPRAVGEPTDTPAVVPSTDGKTAARASDLETDKLSEPTDAGERTGAVAPPPDGPEQPETDKGARRRLADELSQAAQDSVRHVPATVDPVDADAPALRETPARILPPVALAPRSAEAELPTASAELADPELSDQFFTGPLRAVVDGPPEPDSRYQVGAPRRVARSRWILGFVLLGAVTLLGLATARRVSVPSEPIQSPLAEANEGNARAQELTRAGVDLFEQGDLDGAAEKLAQARILSDRDPAVLSGLARLENARADRIWLRLRLLDPADRELADLVSRELKLAVARAWTAFTVANEVAPHDPAVIRAHVDWLRIAGDVGKARELVGPLSTDPSDPGNAYVMATLDLGEGSPVSSSVVERLRNAARVDQGLGLARGALVYCLVQTGQMEEARTQLVRLDSSGRPYPLAADLRAFVRRRSGGDLIASASTTAPANASSSPTTSAALSLPANPLDVHEQLTRASTLMRAGQGAQAEGIYRAILAQEPNNVEALTGVADVARGRHDPNASALYERVLTASPSHLPALIGLADLKWARGDRVGAATLYRQIVEKSGNRSDYGQRAAMRLAQASETPPRAVARPRRAEKQDKAPLDAVPTPRPLPPDIDTTDLPEFR